MKKSYKILLCQRVSISALMYRLTTQYGFCGFRDVVENYEPKYQRRKCNRCENIKCARKLKKAKLTDEIMKG
jgi:hypothetical protein